MQITEIKKIGKGFRYSMCVDEVFVGVFGDEILAKNALKTGQEIDEDFLNKLKVENGDFASFDRALGLLEHGMKSEREVKDYLKKKGYPIECIDRAVLKLKEYGYINDESYATAFIKTYSSSRGAQKIKFDLLKKGIARDVIYDKLQNLDEQSQFDGCKKFALKKIKNQELDAKFRQKVANYLAGKGYGFALISRVIKEIENDRH